MGKKIAIILGAGASFDLIPEEQKSQAVKDSYFAPPKTSGIATLPHVLEQYLAYYPRAYTAISNMRSRLQNGTETIEGMMRQLKDSTEQSKIQQFKQIPLYLQHIFGLISRNYSYHPINYASLISEAMRSDVERVAFITTNYDLFIDQALSAESDIILDDMSKYISDEKKWLYVKLHGSVNWGRNIKREGIRNPGASLGALLDNVARLNLDTELEEKIEVVSTYLNRPNVEERYYPAITVPVDNKYEFNCPSEHVETLKLFLQDCKNFLIIGSSGKDQDVIDLLKQHTRYVNFVTVVCNSTAEQTKERFKDAISQFQPAGWRDYDGGFSKFVHSRDLGAFFDTAV